MRISTILLLNIIYLFINHNFCVFTLKFQTNVNIIDFKCSLHFYNKVYTVRFSITKKETLRHFSLNDSENLDGLLYGHFIYSKIVFDQEKMVWH